MRKWQAGIERVYVCVCEICEIWSVRLRESANDEFDELSPFTFSEYSVKDVHKYKRLDR